MKTEIILLSVIIFMCSCHTGPKTYDEHLARLRGTVPPKALESEDEWVMEYGDFTGDGKDKMIAFVYEVTDMDEEMEWGNYYLYYSTRDTLTLCDTLDGVFYKAPEMIETGNAGIIFYTIGYGGPSGESFCWKCTDNGLVPVSMPGELERIGDNYFKCTKSGFDSFREDGEEESFWPGRCFYNYYYFFDGERFREYGGKSLSEQQFCDTFGGADILQQLMDNGLTIENIYYRANGIIDINCSCRTSQSCYPDDPPKFGKSFMYIELELTDSGFETEKGLQPGRIKMSLTPDYAVYPD